MFIIFLVTYQPREEALEISKAIHKPTHKDASRTTLDKSKPARLPEPPFSLPAQFLNPSFNVPP
jgi:hypothetical protein